MQKEAVHHSGNYYTDYEQRAGSAYKAWQEDKKKFSFLWELFFIALNLYTAIHANSMGIAPKESHINARSFHVKGSIASGFVIWVEPKSAIEARLTVIATPIP